MIHCAEEARGVFAFSLYEARACAAIVERVKSVDAWMAAEVRENTADGRFDSSVKADIRAASMLAPERARDIFQDFDEQVNRVVKPLVKQIWRVDLPKHFGTQIIRYAPGGHYVAHQDAGMDMENRYFTLLCYLNDDFEGGTTWFPSLGYSATPQTGKAILFPAKYFHCAEPVLKGEKYVWITWILGPVPIKWI